MLQKKCSLFIKINLWYEPEWNKQSRRRREHLGWPQPQVGNSQTCWNHTLPPQQDSLSLPSQGHRAPRASEVAPQPSHWKTTKGLSFPEFFLLVSWQGFQITYLSRLNIRLGVSNTHAHGNSRLRISEMDSDGVVASWRKHPPFKRVTAMRLQLTVRTQAWWGRTFPFFKDEPEIWIFFLIFNFKCRQPISEIDDR